MAKKRENAKISPRESSPRKVDSHKLSRQNKNIPKKYQFWQVEFNSITKPLQPIKQVSTISLSFNLLYSFTTVKCFLIATNNGGIVRLRHLRNSKVTSLI